jgi:hypothetical protein
VPAVGFAARLLGLKHFLLLVVFRLTGPTLRLRSLRVVCCVSCWSSRNILFIAMAFTSMGTDIWSVGLLSLT